MKEILIGLTAPLEFSGLVFFAIIGVFVSLLIQTTKRDVTSTNTPFGFSWSFLFSDNVKRLVLSILLIYLALRFTPDIIGMQVNNFVAFSIGLSFDKLAQFVKDKTNIFGK